MALKFPETSYCRCYDREKCSCNALRQQSVDAHQTQTRISCAARARFRQQQLYKQIYEPGTSTATAGRSGQARYEAMKRQLTQRAVLASKGYLIHGKLGSGHYSTVFRAESILKRAGNDKDFAVKFIDLEKVSPVFRDKFLPRELDIFSQLNHPNIVRLVEHFQIPTVPPLMAIVMEVANGGNLLNFVQKNGYLTENRARDWFLQIAGAVHYLHDHGFAHRDLKMENVLVGNDKLLLADFGFACYVTDTSRTFCGSAAYSSPQILLKEPYSPFMADVWSLGVMLYILLTAKMPFDERSGNKGLIVLDQKACAYPRYRNHAHKESMDCVDRMLTFEEAERPSITEVLKFEWLKQGLKTNVGTTNKTKL